jgi:hypothetical protein
MLPSGFWNKDNWCAGRRFGPPDFAGRKFFSELFSECLQLFLREGLNRPEWWHRTLDQLNAMVILRVVREAVDFFLGEPVCDITALLVMPLDIGTGGLASRPRFFGTGGLASRPRFFGTGGLACRPGIGLSCQSDTGGFLARFGIGMGFARRSDTGGFLARFGIGLRFPILPSWSSLMKFCNASHIESGKQWVFAEAASPPKRSRLPIHLQVELTGKFSSHWRFFIVSIRPM